MPAQASTFSPACGGWVTQQPDHIVQLNTPFNFLRIYAVSNIDITLVVRTPQGIFMCDDDTYGTNPKIEGPFQPGAYQLWMGSYESGQQAAYQLSFTELQSNQPAG